MSITPIEKVLYTAKAHTTGGRDGGASRTSDDRLDVKLSVPGTRVGHVHVRLDDAPWVWADASGNPIILMGLPPGPHKVLIELEDANHHPLDQGTVAFVVPEKSTAEKHP